MPGLFVSRGRKMLKLHDSVVMFECGGALGGGALDGGAG